MAQNNNRKRIQNGNKKAIADLQKHLKNEKEKRSKKAQNRINSKKPQTKEQRREGQRGFEEQFKTYSNSILYHNIPNINLGPIPGKRGKTHIGPYTLRAVRNERGGIKTAGANRNGDDGMMVFDIINRNGKKIKQGKAHVSVPFRINRANVTHFTQNGNRKYLDRRLNRVTGRNVTVSGTNRASGRLSNGLGKIVGELASRQANLNLSKLGLRWY